MAQTDLYISHRSILERIIFQESLTPLHFDARLILWEVAQISLNMPICVRNQSIEFAILNLTRHYELNISILNLTRHYELYIIHTELNQTL